MKVAALELSSFLVRLRRSAADPGPAARSLCPPSGGSCTPAAGGRSPRPLLAATEEAGSWAGDKALLITLPDIGEEAVAESDAEEAACNLRSPRKGLFRGSTNRYHSGKSGESLPAVFERNVQEAINSYSCEMLSSVSSSGHATLTDLNNSWSGIKSCTTGLSTERSSVYSWRDDEFDEANTQRVHQLFWDIDEMLFEGKVTSQTQSLQAECADWVERSLHLRVLGKQILSPKNEGFQHFESRNDSSVDTKCLPGLHECTSNIKELCISGSKLVPKVSPVQKSISSNSTTICGTELSTYSFLEEEIYDADGKMEEYLAFDIKELDDECLEQKKIHLAEKRSKNGIPPVSPMACIRDAVASEIFDHLWSNVIGILEKLIKKHLETNVTESAKQSEKLKAVTGKLPAVRVTADVGSVLLSRGSEARSVSFGSHLASSQVHHFSSSFCSDLNGVMTIQAKPLQQRHFAAVQKIQNEQEDKPHSISSSAPNSVHTSLGRIADSHVLSSSRVLLASARKLPSHRRLPSLTSDQLSSKAPNMYNDEILRGTKLVANLDRLSSGSAHTARNKLPPINSEAVKQYPLVVPQLQQGSHRGQHAHSRVSSAVPGSTEQQPVRERTVTDRFSRPSTTHTFRTDRSQKRSLTPMDFSNHRGTSQGFLIGSQHYYKSFHRNPLTSRRRFQITS
ncbi:protein FAM149A isoform X2 [Tympanuchus pallidicinctus]|uniref:protein FAM149A isoform X2 n=1 Tax=Tympanuchus pallidicinctus TaxID=109042 RepID=UPI002286EDA9|nr:protein FAM149A isoform X2 [Tympanuchus pallidicinctus]